MRFTPTLLSALTLSVVPLSVSASNAVAIVAPRSSIVDVCANIDLNLVTQLNGLLGLSLPNIFGSVDVCLCVGALPAFIDANIVTRLAVGFKGRDAVTSSLAAIIGKQQGSKSCSYPTHCTQTCNKGTPCDFTCTDGYTKSGKDCICPAGKNVCNGKCQSGPCQSKGYYKRDQLLFDGVPSTCPTGYEMCGVYNMPSLGLGRRGWECLETRSNLESCGGCVVPMFGKEATGRDCSSIPHVSSVSCSAGGCLVKKCKAPFVVDSTNSSCIRQEPVAIRSSAKARVAGAHTK